MEKVKLCRGTQEGEVWYKTGEAGGDKILLEVTKYCWRTLKGRYNTGELAGGRCKEQS